MLYRLQKQHVILFKHIIDVCFSNLWNGEHQHVLLQQSHVPTLLGYTADKRRTDNLQDSFNHGGLLESNYSTDFNALLQYENTY